MAHKKGHWRKESLSSRRIRNIFRSEGKTFFLLFVEKTGLQITGFFTTSCTLVGEKVKEVVSQARQEELYWS